MLNENMQQLVPWAITAASVGYAVYVTVAILMKKNRCNYDIDKDNKKVVHSVDIEDIGTKKCFCRCWKSKKFPYCDGSHTKHNEETGDNVGPLIVKQKES